MAALVGRIDASKSLFDGKLSETPRLVLLPSGPVQETGDSNTLDQHGPLRHGLFRLKLAIFSKGFVRQHAGREGGGQGPAGGEFLHTSQKTP